MSSGYWLDWVWGGVGVLCMLGNVGRWMMCCVGDG